MSDTITLTPAEIAYLRSLISQSRRRQELYLDTIGDAIVLAVEQVQDKRIEHLESGPEVDGGTLFVNLLINLAFGIAAPPFVKSVTKFLLTPLIRTRSALVDTKTIELVAHLTTEAIRNAQRIELTTTFTIRKSEEQHKLFIDIAEKLAGLGVAEVKSKITPKGKKIRSAKEQAGGDSPSVALIDAVQVFIQQQKFAVNVVHDHLDILISLGKVPPEVPAELRFLLTQDINSQKPPKANDIAEIKRAFMLFYEACIWVKVFGGVKGIVSIHKERQSGPAMYHAPGLITTVSWQAPETLKKYWTMRFSDLGVAQDIKKVMEFFNRIERQLGIRYDNLNVIRLPKNK